MSRIYPFASEDYSPGSYFPAAESGVSADELKYFLEDSSAKLFFALETFKEKIQSIFSDLPDLQECIFLNPADSEYFNSLITSSTTALPDSQFPISDTQDTAVIIYTSGTTERPKGAEITQGLGDKFSCVGSDALARLECLRRNWLSRPGVGGKSHGGGSA